MELLPACSKPQMVLQSMDSKWRRMFFPDLVSIPTFGVLRYALMLAGRSHRRFWHFFSLTHYQQKGWDIKFQTQDIWLRCVFNTSKLDLATRFHQFPSVIACYRVWLTYPTLYPELSGPAAGLSSQKCYCFTKCINFPMILIHLL